jgi:hypothetical protein
MMLRPARAQLRRGEPGAVSRNRPAPVLGWNARDALAEMKPGEAAQLDNWFPGTASCSVRRGSVGHATGLGASVESLMGYTSPTAQKLFGAAGGAIYDATAAGPVGAADVSGLTNDRWQHVNFSTAGGNFLIGVNGDDAPRSYDGSAWATPSITGSGLTAAHLIHVNVYKERLFFIEKNTLDFWYLDTKAISGTAARFTLGSVFRLGGHLMAMATWSRDGGAGLDDLAVFMTSTGEVAIYQGTDPGSADAWALVGRFRLAPPIGRRCMLPLASDVAVVTIDGVFPLSKALNVDRAAPHFALTDKIRDAFNAAARTHGSRFGWQPLLYPRGGAGLFNVPVSGTKAHQYVINTTTGAWCRFLGMNGLCWELLGEELYFGGVDGTVYKADSGTGDDGDTVNIEANALTAYDYFGAKGQRKACTMIRPVMKSEAAIPVAVAVCADFQDRQATSIPSPLDVGGTPWGSPWGSPWSSGSRVRTGWQGAEGYGYCFALRVRTATKFQRVEWVSNDWMLEPLADFM